MHTEFLFPRFITWIQIFIYYVFFCFEAVLPNTWQCTSIRDKIFQHFVSENPFVCLYLKDTFTRYRILGWLVAFLPLPLGCSVLSSCMSSFSWEIACYSYFDPLYITCPLSLFLEPFLLRTLCNLIGIGLDIFLSCLSYLGFAGLLLMEAPNLCSCH